MQQMWDVNYSNEMYHLPADPTKMVTIATCYNTLVSYHVYGAITVTIHNLFKRSNAYHLNESQPKLTNLDRTFLQLYWPVSLLKLTNDMNSTLTLCTWLCANWTTTPCATGKGFDKIAATCTSWKVRVLPLQNISPTCICMIGKILVWTPEVPMFRDFSEKRYPFLAIFSKFSGYAMRTPENFENQTHS